ncbi:MAG: KH domain-containing protein [Victivallales bacterium]|nr:KH domain-containing protein [Victivallales bacterium]
MVFSLFKKLFSSEEGKVSEDVKAGAVEGADVEPVQAADTQCADTQDEVEERSERGGRNRRPRRPSQHPAKENHPAQQLAPEEEEKVMSRLQEMVLFIAKSLVDEPEQISVELTDREGVRVLMISCEKKDAGKLIGRNGRIIAAIRILVSGTAAKYGLKVTVDIVD